MYWLPVYSQWLFNDFGQTNRVEKLIDFNPLNLDFTHLDAKTVGEFAEPKSGYT